MTDMTLGCFLEDTCERLRYGDTLVNMVTIHALSTRSTGIDCTIQPMTPREVQEAFGIESQGGFKLFAQSTIDIVEGDLIKASDARMFHARGVHVRNESGFLHLRADLELTTQSTADLNAGT